MFHKVATRCIGTCSELVTPRYKTIVVEGNIASGKTEFLKHFKNYDQIQTVAEPVEKWQNVRGHNTLDLMYTNPEKYSLTFQTYVQLTMLQAHLSQPKPNVSIKVMERSLFSAKHIFAENLFRSGKMKKVELAVLTEWFDWVKNRMPPVDEIIYLRTSPSTSQRRLAARGRKEEKTVSLSFLNTIHDLHEEWLMERRIPFLHSNTKLRVIDGDMELGSEEMERSVEEMKTDWNLTPPSPFIDLPHHHAARI